MDLIQPNVKRLLKQTPLLPMYREVKSYTVPLLDQIKGNIRSDWNTVSQLWGNQKKVEEPLLHQWRRIIKRSKPYLDHLPNPSGPKVLIASNYGFSPTKTAFESILSMGLRLKGSSPVALVCNKTLSACEFNPLGNFKPYPQYHETRLFPHAQHFFCNQCTNALDEIFTTLEIPQVLMSEYSRADDLDRLYKIVSNIPYDSYRDQVYRDIRVGEHAFASMLRATLRGTLLDNEQTRWLYKRYLVSTMHLVDLMERVLEREAPDRIVATHGVYITHGTITEMARKFEIPIAIFGIPYRQGTVWLSHSETYHRSLIDEPTEIWENDTLTLDQNKRLDAYIASKQSGGRDYFNYHPNPIENKQKIIESLGLDIDRPVISLFTNVLWDAQIYYKGNAFSNMLEWLFCTIEYFEKRPDLQFVIRIHPAEVKGGMPTNQPISAEIAEKFPVLPGNIKVINPESDLSSYTLVEISQAALIYGTKMGLEIALRGVPVIVAGETFSRGKGFTYDVSTKEEYFEILNHIENLPRNSPEKIERARRFAYYIFFRRMLDFPFYSVKDPHRSTELWLRFSHISELAPGQNEVMDLITDGITKRTPFWRPYSTGL